LLQQACPSLPKPADWESHSQSDLTVEKAKLHGSNLSRITEQALFSILGFLDAQNPETSSMILGEAFFQEGSMVPRAGFEPKTRGDVTRNSPFFFLPLWSSFGLLVLRIDSCDAQLSLRKTLILILHILNMYILPL